MTLLNFFQWWRDGLVAAVPARLRRLLISTPPVLVVSRTGDGTRFAVQGEPHAHEEPLFPAADRPGEGLKAWLKAHVPANAEVHVAAAPGEVLGTEINLPAATAENLAEVVGFEMDRFTPFRTDAVYYGFEVVGLVEDNLRVRLSVVPRQGRAPLVEALERLGLKVTQIVPAEAGRPPITEGLRENAPAPSGGRTRLSLTLTAAALAGIAVYLPFNRAQHDIEDIEARIAVLRREAMSLRVLEDRLQESLQGARAVAERKENTVLTIDLLAEVTKALPDNAWTYRLSRRGAELSLQGEAAEANALLGAVEGVPLLKDASFRSTVQRNNATGMDRYQIAATITPPVGLGSATDPGSLGADSVSNAPTDAADSASPRRAP